MIDPHDLHDFDTAEARAAWAQRRDRDMARLFDEAYDAGEKFPSRRQLISGFVIAACLALVAGFGLVSIIIYGAKHIR